MRASAKIVAGSALVLSLGALPGCYGNESTQFPPGVEPWEENLAPMPPPDGEMPCAEELSFHRGMFGRVRSVHARACIHQPIEVVWRALRNPQTGRDPVSTADWRVLEWDVARDDDPAPDYSYETWTFVDDIIDLEFEQIWRHHLVEGTDDAPLLTATRWQKTFGTTAISVMEGSIVARPLDEDPSITLLEYQYHLDAVARDEHDVIEGFVQVIYGRLRQDAHGETLEPSDCRECPEPPADYL